MTACIIVPECKIKVLKHWKSYKDTYILQESFAMTDKSYTPPCRNYLQPLYLSVTLYACAQRDVDAIYMHLFKLFIDRIYITRINLCLTRSLVTLENWQSSKNGRIVTCSPRRLGGSNPTWTRFL